MINYFQKIKKNFVELKPLSKLLAIFALITFIMETYSIFFINIIEIKDIIFLFLLVIIIMVLVKRNTELKQEVGLVKNQLVEKEKEFSLTCTNQINSTDFIMERIHNFLHYRRFLIHNLFELSNEFQNQKMNLSENLMNEFLEKDKNDDDFVVSAVYLIINISNIQLKDELKTLKEEFPGREDSINYIIRKKSNLYLDFQNKIEKVTKKYLTALMAHVVKSIELRNSIENIDEKISASIQMLTKPTTRKNLKKEIADNYEFFTYFRDPETYNLNTRNLFEHFKISSNTLFEKSFWGKSRRDWFQYSNNMKLEQTEHKIKIQRENFWEFYNATANVPIQFHNGNNVKYPNIYGFLSVDCKNNNEKDIFSFEKHFHILSLYADSLASYFKTFDELFPDLFLVNHN